MKLQALVLLRYSLALPLQRRARHCPWGLHLRAVGRLRHKNGA